MIAFFRFAFFRFAFFRLAFFLVDFLHIWVFEHYPLNPAAQHLAASLLLDQHSHDAIENFFSLTCWEPLLFIFPVGINKDCPRQGEPGKLPPAQCRTPFFAGVAVAVPVDFFCSLDCLLPCDADAPGTGDKGVGELLQRPLLVALQRLTVLQLVVAFLQHTVVHPFNFDLIEIQPQNTVYVGSSSPLKLHSIADVPHFHGVVLAKDHLFPEGLDTMLEISGGKENISRHHSVLALVHMISQVLLPRFLSGRLALSHFNCHILFAQMIHIVVHFAAQFLQFWCEVGAPPEVTRSEGEEQMERSDILKLGDDLVSYALPVLRSPWDLLEHRARVFHLV